MIGNYLKIAWRNLIKNRASSFINIAGLTVGMAAAIVIALWVWDELSFNTYHRNYDRIAQVMQQETFNHTITTSAPVPLPLDAELKKSYGNDFKHVVLLSFTQKHVLNVNDKIISFPGSFIAPDGPEMFTLHMLKGDYRALNDPSSIIISESVAKALFGDNEPMDKLIKLDNKASFKVSGVYADLPVNTTLRDIAFLAPWDYFYATAWANNPSTTWTDNSFRIYVQLADHADMAKVSAKIRDIKLKKINAGAARSRPVIFLQPMSKWHLYTEFKNGINTGGAIQYVWLLGIIGAFVLLLACINFMNLSTARSEKRAREVGIRKAVGSLRGQLITQFFCESLLIVTLAFIFSIVLVWLALPWFNELTGKQMAVLWNKPLFWAAGLGFTCFTGFVAGLYPALYLSSFNPVKVLKGTFKAGKLASVPRKALVVIQFSVSVILIIGTIIVFKQIQFAKDRPVGYSRDGLVYLETVTDALHPQFKPMRDELLKSGSVVEAAESSSPTTEVWNNRGDITWTGKDPSMTVDFGNLRVTTGYGKTVGWQFVGGRDFSERFLSDSSAVVLNESAVKYMDLKNPVGETIKLGTWGLTVIGVVKDMVMQSPYESVKPTLFYLSRNGFSFLNFKLNPNLSAQDALAKVATIYKTYAPAIPFSYRFADDEYAKKFASEVRIGKLAWCFSALAIFISCMGLFGMASFMAEQRRKEIGVRKVLGASVFSLWQAMSMDFLRLVTLSLLIASPVAYYFVHGWLQHYTYRAAMSWWIFAATAAGSILITLLTVSYQSLKAATTNPVKSLKVD